ncbi:MAG: HD domain-containing protein [Zoogloeaceae bacterium]|jgi:HD-GYP domain-containing protein (c-di-GMP phosphodiesterase class II)/phosphoribosyl 1,2-cyclic phosphodiesterase|nr:HD domain-containing protein [Zoogloeaceae bacterium]
MKLNIFGARGNRVTTGPSVAFYGGDTSSYALQSAAGDFLFLDAGSGLARAGNSLPESGVAHVLLTHGHPDHTCGFWYFAPLHNPRWTVHLYLPEHLAALPDWPHQTALFPLSFTPESIDGRLIVHPVCDGRSFDLEGTQIRATPFATRHPGGCLGYRLALDDACLVYTGDHEIDMIEEPGSPREITWLAGADLAIVDATYGRDTLPRGFGHSAWEDWVDVARRAGLPRLILAHHLPESSDAALDALADAANQQAGKTLHVHVACQDAVFSANAMLSPPATARSDWLARVLKDSAKLNDTSAVLDALLAQARRVSRADAGTIYLVEGDELVFSYTHNDTLFPGNAASKFAYLSMRLPISEDSIAGYVAKSVRTLDIPDVFDLPPETPCHFNDAFDKKTGYATYSMLVVPFIDGAGKVLGVMQLINSLDPVSGKPQAFPVQDAANVELLAREAASVIERAQLQRRGIKNVLQMAELHDPGETGAHVERVGAIAAELYQRWAERHDVGPEFLRHHKSNLRLAAMLHDIGKVGISERILKKPGKLSDEEFTCMRGHPRLGAEALCGDDSDLAEMARAIVAHHHQKWNGKGYAGETDEGRLAGDAIPLPARITSIADVFDALVSPRCYKKAWSFEDALLFLIDHAGTDFDPELVACFQDIVDVIRDICHRYPDLAPEKTD